MSAAKLREAAALMRSRAKAVIEADPDDWYRAHEHEAPFGRWAGPEDAAHIASWHPAVALAVAVWLEKTASGIERRGVTARITPAETAALSVATAYLGSESC